MTDREELVEKLKNEFGTIQCGNEDVYFVTEDNDWNVIIDLILDEVITEFHNQRIIGLAVTSPTRHHNVNSQIDWAIKVIDNLRGESEA